MRQPELVKVAARRITDIHRRLCLEPASQGLIDGDPTPAEFLALLLDKGNHRDAVRLLAHALPGREAVWWACVCVRESTARMLPGDDMRLLMAVEAWVFTPSVENRRRVSGAMGDADLTGPVAFIGAAVASTHHDPRRAEYPRHSPEQLRGMAVAGAIMLGAQYVEPARRQDAYTDFLRRGVAIAQGGSGH